MSTRGGKRPNAGRAKDCAGKPAKAHQVTIDDDRANKARAAGNGNLSRGIRVAIDALPEVHVNNADTEG